MDHPITLNHRLNNNLVYQVIK